MLFALVYLLAAAVFSKDAAVQSLSGDRLTAMLVESSLPCMELAPAESGEEAPKEKGKDFETADTEKKSREETETKKVKKDNGPPRVLIYHTHATESYLPASAGNYHTTKEKNTVREAGMVLENTLEEAGIGVVHDKTLHDNPSYDQSYSRSFETVKALLKQYPSIECIVDLHRDATAGDVKGPVETVDGKTVAAYSYVLSNTSPTYEDNQMFLHELNSVAQSDYGGYTGRILERPYWYNQELLGKSVLVEMGNNRNNIQDVLACAEVFGEILAKALK